MPLDREKKLIKDGLKNLRYLEGFEKSLRSPPTVIWDIIRKHSGKGPGAEVYRLEGNELFTKSKHDICVHYSIIEKYNKSILAAPPNSELLALAYANRSAIFEHVGKYKASIMAIDRALAITDSPVLKVKMFCRKAKCATAIGLSDETEYLEQAECWLDQVDKDDKARKTLKNLINKTVAIVKNRYEDCTVMTIDEVEEVFVTESLSRAETETNDSVREAYSEKYGRHLIATRNIKPGEILVLEKNCKSCLDGEQTFFYCWHCCSFLWDIVPCDSCTMSAFCSERCKIEAWEKYHELECRHLTAIAMHHEYLSSLYEPLESPTSNQLGLRIFFTALKQCGSASNLRASLKAFDNDKNQDHMEDLPADDYRRIYALSSNMRRDDMNHLVMDSVIQMIILAKSTPLLKDICDNANFTAKQLMHQDDLIYFGALLLKFCTVSNTHGFENFRRFDCKREIPCEMIGAGPICWLFGVKTSLTRRSCIPNVRRCMIGNNQIILYSLMPIKKGAQIFDSHSSIFDIIPKIERLKIFRERYDYPCTCRSCKENWPAIKYELSRDYYPKVVHTLSGESLERLNEYISLINFDSEQSRHLSLIQRVERYSLLIQNSVEKAPLPTELTAYIIKGFISLMEMSHGFANRIQIDNDCWKHLTSESIPTITFELIKVKKSLNGSISEATHDSISEGYLQLVSGYIVARFTHLLNRKQQQKPLQSPPSRGKSDSISNLKP